jgi:Transposase DDE domain group 1
VIAKVEWHPSELYPRIGFIATNLSRPAERVAAFYNKRGTAEQWIKEGKGAIKWTRCRAGQMAEVAIPRQMFQEILRSRNYGRSRYQRRREAFDDAFRSNGWEECVLMPGKMARSAPRPPIGLPEVAVRTSCLSSREAGKALIFTPVRESSGESRVNTRPHACAERR